MRGIGVEKTAAIGAKHFDRDLRGHGAYRDGLFGALQRCRIDVSAESLGHPLPHQEQRIGYADRNEDVERRTGDIDPEITDRADRIASEAANERHGECDAGSR